MKIDWIGFNRFACRTFKIFFGDIEYPAKRCGAAADFSKFGLRLDMLYQLGRYVGGQSHRDCDCHALLTALVCQQIKLHGDDAEKSLRGFAHDGVGASLTRAISMRRSTATPNIRWFPVIASITMESPLTSANRIAVMNRAKYQ